MATGDGRADQAWTTIREADPDEIARVVQFLLSCGVAEDALRIQAHSDGAASDGLLSRFRRTSAHHKRDRLLVRDEYIPKVIELLRPFRR